MSQYADAIERLNSAKGSSVDTDEAIDIIISRLEYDARVAADKACEAARQERIERPLHELYGDKTDYLHPRLYAHRRFATKSRFHAAVYGALAAIVTFSAALCTTIFLMALVDIRMVLHGGGLGVVALTVIQIPIFTWWLFPYINHSGAKMWSDRHEW